MTVHEEADTIGGGCRTAELTLPGFRHDVCAAILPLARNSPAFAGLDVDWVDPPFPAAHALDGDAVALARTLEDTAYGLGADAQTYRALVQPFVRAWPKRWSRWDLVRLRPSLIRGLLSARAVARLFDTERARALFAGQAAHSVLPLESAGSAGFGFTLCAAAHVDGWPFPRGDRRRSWTRSPRASRRSEARSSRRAASTSFRAQTSSSAISRRASSPASPAYRTTRAPSARRRPRSSSTGRWMGRSPGRATRAATPAPCIWAEPSRRSRTRSARRGRATTPARGRS